MHTRKIAFVLLLVLLSLPLAAQMTPAQPAEKPAPPVQDELLYHIAGHEKKLVALAEAIPQEKYNWRPQEGVRSFAEVFLHVAAANYMLGRAIGHNPPEGLDLRALEKSTTDRAKVVETLKNSFAHVREAVKQVSGEQLTQKIKLFGSEITKRNAAIIISNHGSEHLGQAIAYARISGITPPWSQGDN